MRILPPLIQRFCILGIFALMTAGVLAISFFPSDKNAMLGIHFFDVGQGDAIFIESPEGYQVLIDGGPDRNVLRELSRAMGFFDREIDMLIASHEDKDHIGGLIDVLARYRIKTIILTENTNDTPAAAAFRREIANEGAHIIYARRGQKYSLGSEPEAPLLAILFPDRDPSLLETNTASIVAQLRYGDIGFLFTGDAPQGIETYLVELDGAALESEVLKVGHHGSRTSTSEQFVAAVDPRFAVISAGKSNTYGHPHAEVLHTLEAASVYTKNTADGSIDIFSDGADVWIE